MKMRGIVWSRGLLIFFLLALGVMQAKAEPGDLVEIRAKVYTTKSDGTEELIAEPNLIITMGEWAGFKDQNQITVPTAWTLPSIPRELSGSIKADPALQTGNAWTTNAQRALIPSQPLNFETRDYGLALEFRPRLDENGEIIVDCRVDQELFDGFLASGNPVRYQAGPDPEDTIVLLSNSQRRAEFRQRKMEMVFLRSDEGLVAKTTFESVLPKGTENLPGLRVEVSANRLATPEPELEGNDRGDLVYVTAKFIESPDLVTPGSRVFTEKEFQLWIRDMNSKTEVDLLSAPSILLPSGQNGEVEIIREFIYPFTYDPPQLVKATKSKGGSGAFPVTPSTPTEFETRNIGITMGVLPRILSDGRIELEVSPSMSEFEEFLNFGETIFQVELPLKKNPKKIALTDNRIEMPRFSELGLESTVKIHSGQTFLIGGLIREDVQDVEDSVPILGDLPLIGKYARSRKELRIKRYIYIAVTATRMEKEEQE